MKWTDESLLNESKKYTTRTEFARKSNSAYKHSLKRGIIDKMDWLSKNTDNRPRCVYVYTDEENMVVYVGITVNKEKRHNQHKTGMFSPNKTSKSPVYEYFSHMGKCVPEPKYLEDNLTIEKAQEMEKYWVDVYKSNGYTLLNKAKVGVGCSSIGLHFKWTDETVIEESKKYTSRKDFMKNSPYSFEYARKHKLFDRMPWIKRLVRTEWTKEEVFEESRKYGSRVEFCKKRKTAYCVALKNGWIDEMTWLHRPESKIKWTKELVFEESHKYRNRNEFSRKCSRAYSIARENGWLDEMVWFETKRKVWTVESAKNESRKYGSRSEFKRMNRGAFNFLYKRNMIDETAFENNWK